MSKKKNWDIPPCPGNPEDFTLVRPKNEPPHWRRNRGTVKPAKLNASFKNNLKLNKIVSPIASLIKKKLMPFLEGMETGRFVANVSGLLRKEYYRTGKIDFLGLKNYDLQPEHRLQTLLRRSYDIKIKKDEVIIEIPLDAHAVPRGNRLMTGYIFEAILLYGDLTKANSLRIDSEASPIYDFRMQSTTICRLSLLLPTKKVSWMFLLKLSCTYGSEMADHKKYKGMKVLCVSGE